MINILLSGCCGYMGCVVSSIVEADPDVSIVAGVDIAPLHHQTGYPVFSTLSEFTGQADVVLDFSSPSALQGLLDFSLSQKIPLILCATGYSDDQLTAISAASELVPVFRSGNMSLGINLLVDLISRACSVLGGAFDVEIIERHHRRKVDAPSGTALMLANAASSALPFDANLVFERNSSRKPRSDNEIGISALRGGTIVGVHEVVFAGLDEVIELKHSAASRDVFAVGALRAAKFMVGALSPGLYNMTDVLSAIPTDI